MDFWTMMVFSVLLISAGVTIHRQRKKLDVEEDRVRWLRERAEKLEVQKEAADKSIKFYRTALDKRHGEIGKLREALTREERLCAEALLEQERCRKECAMHEMERRQLVQKLETLRDEYAKLLSQETDAETMLRTEMANFLSYTGSEDGQKELRVHDAD